MCKKMLKKCVFAVFFGLFMQISLIFAQDARVYSPVYDPEKIQFYDQLPSCDKNFISESSVVYNNFRKNIPQKDDFTKDSEIEQLRAAYFKNNTKSLFCSVKETIRSNCEAESSNCYIANEDSLLVSYPSRKIDSSLNIARASGVFQIYIPTSEMRAIFKELSLMTIFEINMVKNFTDFGNEVTLIPSRKVLINNEFELILHDNLIPLSRGNNFRSDFSKISSNGGGYSNSGAYSSSKALVPLKKVSPVYPRRALERGTQGYVIVSFTIERDGTVSDIKAIESKCKNSPSGSLNNCSVFNYSAKRAAEKLRFPSVNAPILNHTHKFSFQLKG